ncbi:MAG: DUF4258 domain-containing protein [archaeon]
MISLDITKCELEFKQHVFERANERDIDLEDIYSTIWNGKISRFGKNFVKFTKNYKNQKLVCVGILRGTRLEIITVYKK